MRNGYLAALTAATLAGPALAMGLTSSDIDDGRPLKSAQIYPRCGGANISPALSWSGAPAGTRSYVLTLIDTSVKPSGWSHWIVTGIPASTHDFAKGIAHLPPGATVVKSNFGDPFYERPVPA